MTQFYNDGLACQSRDSTATLRRQSLQAVPATSSDLASAGSFFASVARWLIFPDQAESVQDQNDNEYERGRDREHDLHRRFPYRERNLNNGSPKPGFRKRDELFQLETAPECSRRGQSA